MRTIDSNITGALGGERTVNVRYTSRDNLLQFEPDVLADSLGQSNTALADADYYSTGVLRAVNYGGTLYTQEVTDITSSSFPNWATTGIALKANSRPGVSGDTIWFQSSDGNIKSAVFSGGSLGTPTTRSTAFTSYTVTCAPVASNECFLHYLDGTWGAIARVKVGVSVEYWPGRVYGTMTSTQYFDAATLNSVSYLYFHDTDDGRIVELSYNDGTWSQTEYIIPLDIVDDSSYYRLHAVTVIDSKLFITSQISRPNDSDTVRFDAYLIGPRPVTLGREMYITADDVLGKMFLFSTTVYYLGINMICEAPATEIVGVDNSSLKQTSTAIAAVTVADNKKAPLQADLDIPSSVSHVSLKSGGELLLEAGYDGFYSDIGKFVIDSIDKPKTSSEERQQLKAYGLGLWKMASWYPDMDYDLTGHGFISDAPNELTSVVRARGTWEVSSSSLVMNYRNTLGLLYGANRPGRGGIARAKFYNPSGTTDWIPEYGVCINYRQEAKYEAAERLGVELEQVNKADFGDNGLLAIYGPTQHSSASGIGLYSWVDSTPTLLTSASLSIPDDTWHWLYIYFVDGLIKVFYRLDSSSSWTEVISHTYTSSDLPWLKDYRGHGAVYLENKTTSTTAYNFRSDSMIIGVNDASDLPSSGVLEMGSEQIQYSAKTGTTGGLESGAEMTVVADTYFKDDDISSFTGNPIVLDTAGSVEGQNAYDGYAAVVTDGPGVGKVFTVSDYQYETPQIWVPTGSYTPPDTWQDHIGEGGYGSYQDSDMRRIFVTETVGSDIGEGSKIRVVPSVTVTTRGYNDTSATTHNEGVIGVYENLSVKIDWFESYDNEVAQRLEDLLHQVAKHSGVETTSFEKLLGGSQTMSDSGWNITECYPRNKTSIPLFDVPSLSSGDMAGVAFRLPYTPSSLWAAGGDYNDFEDENWGNVTTSGSRVYKSYIGAVHGNFGVVIGHYDDNGTKYIQYDMGSLQTTVVGKVSYEPNLNNLSANIVLMDLVDGARVEINSTLITFKYYDNAGTLQTVGTSSLPSGEVDFEVRYYSNAGNGYAKLFVNGTQVLAATSLTNDLRTVRYLRAGSVTGSPADFVPGDYHLDNFGYSLGGPSTGYMVVIYYDGTDYYLRFYITDGSSWTLEEELKLWFVPRGKVRVAIIDDHFSVWINGCYVTTFRDGTWVGGDYVGYVMYGSGSMEVDLSAVGDHIEGETLSSQQSAMEFANNITANRNIIMRDDQGGGLDVLRNHSDVGTLANIVYSYLSGDLQLAKISRVRGEGLNVVEVADYNLMRTIGNVFAIVNIPLADDIASAVAEVQAKLDDIKTFAEAYQIQLAIDFRLQSGDCATFQLDSNKKLIVDSHSFVIAIEGSGNSLEATATIKARTHYDEL